MRCHVWEQRPCLCSRRHLRCVRTVFFQAKKRRDYMHCCARGVRCWNRTTASRARARPIRQQSTLRGRERRREKNSESEREDRESSHKKRRISGKQLASVFMTAGGVCLDRALVEGLHGAGLGSHGRARTPVALPTAQCCWPTEERVNEALSSCRCCGCWQGWRCCVRVKKYRIFPVGVDVSLSAAIDLLMFRA